VLVECGADLSAPSRPAEDALPNDALLLGTEARTVRFESMASASRSKPLLDSADFELIRFGDLAKMFTPDADDSAASFHDYFDTPIGNALLQLLGSVIVLANECAPKADKILAQVIDEGCPATSSNLLFCYQSKLLGSLANHYVRTVGVNSFSNRQLGANIGRFCGYVVDKVLQGGFMFGEYISLQFLSCLVMKLDCIKATAKTLNPTALPISTVTKALNRIVLYHLGMPLDTRYHLVLQVRASSTARSVWSSATFAPSVVQRIIDSGEAVFSPSNNEPEFFAALVRSALRLRALLPLAHMRSIYTRSFGALTWFLPGALPVSFGTERECSGAGCICLPVADVPAVPQVQRDARAPRLQQRRVDDYQAHLEC
jgi:hypothetical protein